MKLDRAALRQLPLAIKVELEENAQRKPLLQSELGSEQRYILQVLRQYAKPGTRTDLDPTSGKTFPEVRASDLVGKLFGESRKQVEKRQAILTAAESDPENFGKLVEDMDRTGKVNGPFRRLKNIGAAMANRLEVPPLPGNGPYRVAIVDPPWAYEPDDDDAEKRGALPYATMSIDQVCALAIPSLMHDDSVLFLWVTNFILVHGRHLDVLSAWGFAPKTIITWPKDRAGRGHWLRGQTEHMVMAVRGRPTVTSENLSTLMGGPFHLVRNKAHSAKPKEAYTFVEQLIPASRYADIFSRYRHNDRWDCHGDEAPTLKGKWVVG